MARRFISYIGISSVCDVILSEHSGGVHPKGAIFPAIFCMGKSRDELKALALLKNRHYSKNSSASGIRVKAIFVPEKLLPCVGSIPSSTESRPKR